MDARSIEVIPVTSSEVVRILGSLNVKELENVLDEANFSRRIAFIRGRNPQSHVVDRLARTVVSDGTRKEASIRLYHYFDYRDVNV